MKKWILPLLVLILTVPAFVLLFRPGIHAMQDPHLFRQYEFNRCIMSGIFPCRWAPDSGLGYGEPLFNFYGQFAYMLGEIIHLVGFSIINSVKILFILSLSLSGFSMYLVARRYWPAWGALVSAVLYVYAPYRAVDVWVRGALPEAMVFVLLPAIFYFLDRYLDHRRFTHLLGFSLSLAVLIILHNLSFLMLAPFLGLWWLAKCLSRRSFSTAIPLGLSVLLSLGISAFYILPFAFERNLVTLPKTITGYYDFRAHFVTLYQLFISRIWGYGASVWGAGDKLSLSVGQVQWLVPLAVLIWVFVKKKFLSRSGCFFLALICLGGLALFMTHNKSTFIWTHIPVMAYIQFPWRFLGPATFFLSLAGGYIAVVFPKKITGLVSLAVIIAAMALNFSYFRPDYWRSVTDATQFSGADWDEGRSSSRDDFWPVYGQSAPVSFAPVNPVFVSGTGNILKISRTPVNYTATLSVNSPSSVLQFPVVYFPGWIMAVDGQRSSLSRSDQLGLIQSELSAGSHTVILQFTNTPVRIWGNLISVVSVIIFLIIWQKRKSLSV